MLAKLCTHTNITYNDAEKLRSHFHMPRGWSKFVLFLHINHNKQLLFKKSNEKNAQETQTLHAGCSKAEPKIFTPLQTPFPGAGWTNLNQLEVVTTFTYKPSLVRIDARNFKLSW